MNAKTEVERQHSGLPPEVACFPARLKEAMGGIGMRAFGKISGISEGTIFSYLSGSTYPTLDRLAALAKATERPIAWFLGADEVRETALESRSQAARLDADTVLSALKLLRFAFELVGAEYDPWQDPELLADTCTYLIEYGDDLTPDNLVDFGKRLAERRARKGTDEKRGGGSTGPGNPGQGTGTGTGG